MEQEHGNGEGGGGGFVGQGVPRLDAEGAAQQDRGDDEAGVAQDEAEVVEVAEGHDQQEDVDEDEGGEELVVEEVVEVGGRGGREVAEVEAPRREGIAAQGDEDQGEDAGEGGLETDKVAEFGFFDARLAAGPSFRKRCEARMWGMLRALSAAKKVPTARSGLPVEWVRAAMLPARKRKAPAVKGAPRSHSVRELQPVPRRRWAHPLRLWWKMK